MTINITDQLTAIPTGYAVTILNEVISGGTLYFPVLSQAAQGGGSVPVAIGGSSFVGSAAGGIVRFLSLTSAKADTGVAITGTATGGAVGVARTAGTSLVLLGEATSSSAKTDKGFFEFNLPDTYNSAATSFPVVVDAAVLGTGTLTQASTTLSVAAYTEINGVETALTVSAAQTLNAVQQAYTFTVTSTGLLPGAHMGLEVVGLVTSASGANTLELASISFTA